MNKDACFLAEAYQQIVEGKKSKPDYLDVDKDGNKKESFKKAVADKKKSMHKENTEIADAYQQILEASATDKVVNKKLARDYYKAVKAMRKAEHGSKEYEKFKSQKEDIMKIVNDHGKTIADLDAFLTKKEKEEATESVEHCEHAAHGCKCDGCEECKENARKAHEGMSDTTSDVGEV